jgi:hypothetical protein
LFLGTGGEEIVVDFAAAEDDAFDAGRADGVLNDFAEVTAGEFVEAREDGTEQALRGEDDERLADRIFHLAAQDVEVLGRGGAVGDAHVVARGEFEIAFNAGAGVLRALSFVPVREEHDEAAGDAPLRFRAGDELIDHDLRAVGEVAELGFPEDERRGIGQRVAELKTEDAVFAEGAIEDVELRLSGCEVFERDVLLSGFEIVESEMALAEGAAAGILAAEADGGSFEDE